MLIIYRGKVSWPLEQERNADNEIMASKVICFQPRFTSD